MTDYGAEIAKREAEIAQREAEIAELREQAEAFESLTEEQRLAIAMHDALCRYNHTDGCSWLYEAHDNFGDWSRPAHAHWLFRAGRVRAKLLDRSVSEIVEIIRIVN